VGFEEKVLDIASHTVQLSLHVLPVESLVPVADMAGILAAALNHIPHHWGDDNAGASADGVQHWSQGVKVLSLCIGGTDHQVAFNMELAVLPPTRQGPAAIWSF
jgi:hypothetical protein